MSNYEGLLAQLTASSSSFSGSGSTGIRWTGASCSLAPFMALGADDDSAIVLVNGIEVLEESLVMM